MLGIKRKLSFKELVNLAGVSKSYASELVSNLGREELVIANSYIEILDIIEFIRLWDVEKRRFLKRANSFLTDTIFVEDFLSILSKKDYVLSGQFVENLITKQSPGSSLWVYVFNEEVFKEIYKEYKARRTGRIKIILYDDHINLEVISYKDIKL